MNDEKCQACHNPPKPDDPDFAIEKDIWKVRSSVKVSTSMEPVLNEIKRNLYASVGVGILTVLMVGITLRIFMKLVVVKPLLIIGAAADKIGRGDLTVTASVKSEDEIGSLADRINTMIQGLRERLHLTKFVSEETVGAVEGKDMEGVSLGGERKDATVLFSDIRNFTSYSEKVEPEEVIDMLNSYLNTQAEVVKNNGGDIDKFVGDELMAVFKGKSMVEKAVKCSVEIQKKIAVMNKKNKKNIEVGIGINAGPMVMGAMGSKDRMDYTVLGDNVNLGARLCSAAKPGEIIISNRAVRFLPKSHSVDLRPLDPLKVKGKKDVIEVFSIILD
jgi:adenylate cyclase